MYSRIAGSGVASASRGTHSRAPRRQPSDIVIQVFSISRTAFDGALIGNGRVSTAPRDVP
jgi:hypothetical protein